MDEKFNVWAREFDDGFKKSEAYKNLISKGYDQNAKDLLGWYFQFKQERMTRWLVYGTWGLVIATILLIFIK